MPLMYEKESYRIRGAAFEVYKEMGNGYGEPVYQECMEKELSRQDMRFAAQRRYTIAYKGDPLTVEYIPDLVCFEQIIVELKAVKAITNEHKAQVMNYLKTTGLRLGLLINFGHYPGVEIERIVL